MWKHILENKLKVKPEESDILILDNPRASSSRREIMTKLFFEHLCVRSLLIQNTAIAALYGETGGESTSTALIIDGGALYTRCVPIVNGRIVESAVQYLDVGGEHFTYYI